MLELSRTVRFCVNPAADPVPEPGRHNTFAAWPPMIGIGAYYEIVVRCRGQVDPRLGFMVNISRIDEVARRTAVPAITRAVRDRISCEPAAILPEVLSAIQAGLEHEVVSVSWRLTPYYSVSLDANAMGRYRISQQFEFAASHRLHCASISDEENRRLFGKCTRPSGHGHNYRLEVAFSRPMPRDGGPGGPTLLDLERIVATEILERFDHRHLNLDTAEFADLNPSVEHIAEVCYRLLDEPLARAGGRLEQTTVWENAKTSCTYSEPRAEEVAEAG